MKHGRTILQHERLMLTLERLSLSIVENTAAGQEICIIGIQEKGVLFSDQIVHHFSKIKHGISFKYGKLDITFYRDDFRRRETPLKAFTTDMPFLVEGKKVILIDDVLYTGRTIHAAMAALLDFGRPESIELMCLVDRRYNRHFPIQANHVGITIDSLEEAYVKVNWDPEGINHHVLLFPGKI
ncbi:MAG: bifunctional pyr operon transcriptional regulator/uracil phosphoribosyltransferase PyrR [Saprospiraceae bacterium]|nr:bifunctional pyr operon transcriptional regulator/uracil phosphoribosyltransferase PyrR [Saprospiraceae bacterium]MBK6784900.1 bifunctional pyr operon transcriptional regulator/uracil phosphoribosyltransferase PyrR [Saprospiraceae bacterium]MBK7525874.1 bifunctional pyr operon transcriptional regulator/uracil phosphoribosyltransferase PyrR [Saprospiraceae bacterium]MBK8082246.1 bifunctional pyr operon transcriptional regulator/uracil phosphoribosyltransferase PyrR [Saprospiraceae bacterium]M